MATVGLKQINKAHPNSDELTFAVNAGGMQFFDPDTEQAIWTKPAY